MQEMKYIMFVTKGEPQYASLIPIIFPATLDHAFIAQQFNLYDVVSAGFCRMYYNGAETIMLAYGKSVGLQVQARGSDTDILAAMLCEGE